MKRLLISLLSLFFSLSVFAQPSVACDSVLQLGTCAGSQVIVPFTVTGGNFTFGNQFRAELSDQWGNWANPVTIGQISWFTSGIIFATLPQNVNFGFFYRVRVIANNPVDTSNISPNSILVTQSAFLNSVQAFPNDTACWGDSITLGVLMPGSSYMWNTGDTTQTIIVTAPGQYICTTTDFLTCTSQDTLNVYFEICSSGMQDWINADNFSFYPNPSNGKVYINWSPASPSEGELFIKDLSGRILRRIQLESGSIALDLSELSAGLYLATLQSENTSFTKRIVIE